jgi:Protein of unknown function (DUF3489)
MNFKLTTTQRNMLSVAAQREDRCVEPSPELRGSAVRAFATKLIDASLAREIRAKDGFPVWRHDKDAGQNYCLKLTALGMKLASENADTIQPDADTRSNFKSSPPREHSKLSRVMLMLSTEGGSTVEEVSKAMGWLPHTTRATLTGLRKRGIQIIRLTREGERGSSYRIETSPEANLAA